ncbi:MAG: hypothetical protein LC791_17960 [Acidobacteria bacterium]|nr:hypothetical protein [Acidobacteriota bacterium]
MHRGNRQGARCQRAPILGGTVCHYHGGAAPQVQKAAALRMAELVDPAITRLAELMMQTEFPSTAYQAVRDVLDRDRRDWDVHGERRQSVLRAGHACVSPGRKLQDHRGN